MKRRVVILLIAGLWLVSLGTAGAQSGNIPQRSEIPAKYQWRLSDIVADSLVWEAEYAQVKEGIPKIAAYQGRLAESGETLLACLKLIGEIWTINDRLYVYSNMKKDEDTRVAEYQELSSRAEALNSEVAQAVSFVGPEILAADETLIRKYVAQTPGLEVYAHYVDDLLRRKKHVLSPDKEALLAMAGDVTRGPITVFSMIDNADLKYGTIIDEQGKEVQLTKQRYSRFLESTDRRVRRDAAKTFNSAYLTYENTLGANLATQMKCDLFYAKARKYNTCLERALDDYNIPSAVYENLIAAANDNLEPLHRYNALVKKVHGLDTLYKYDLNVPLVTTDAKFPYDDAVETVTRALKPLGQKYVDVAHDGMIGGGWIDVYETAGKTSGGYNWGSYGTNPYILLNYSDKIEDVFTLAHEMGHAMHHYYSTRKQPYAYSDPVTFTAEVASITNEMLLLDYLLKNTKDPELKKYVLNKQISSFIGTFYTQCMFSEYEHGLHQKVEAGGGLSAEGMRRMYRKIFQKYNGPALTMTELDDLGALRVYHYYRNYYVYQYATSIAAATAIADRIINKEKGAVEDYLAFLASGSSDYPIALLQKAGVDMTSVEPINRAINRFDKLVTEFEKLLD